jgi:hypothetical protein
VSSRLDVTVTVDWHVVEDEYDRIFAAPVR